MARTRRLLVLGAGRHQLSLIRRAEERGIEVVASDYYTDAPGKAFASIPVDVDALDVSANLEVARDNGVSGVITIGTDLAVRSMARIAEELGIPCYLTADAGITATDKVRMSQAFAEHGVSRPQHRELSSIGDVGSLDGLRLPVVVKPADSQGQRGTTLVRDREKLVDSVVAALNESRTGRAVVEEFVEGFEVTASAWVENGVPRLLMVTDRVTYNPPPAVGICFQHVFPSLRAQDVVPEIRDEVTRIARSYGMATGPLYVQLIVTPDSRLFIIEAGGRVGGGHESSLIPVINGVDVIDRLIDLAMDGSCEAVGYDYDPGADHVHGLVNFLLAHPGRVSQTAGFDTVVGDDAVEGSFYIGPGYVQRPIVDSLGRVGYFIARDDDRDALMKRSRRVYERLSLCDEAGDEMLFWPEDHLNG